MSKTVVVADDHPLLLSGTTGFLKSKGFEILATAQDGSEAYNAIVKFSPDIAILDFDMPKLNGLEVANACRQKGLTTKLIILTLFKEVAIFNEVGHSIQGYLLKEDALQELELCIQEVVLGKTFCSKHFESSVHFSNDKQELAELTTAEFKILRYLAKNLSSAEIADELYVSKRTVEKHRSNIIKKLNIQPTQHGLLLWVQNHPHLFNA